MWVLFFFFNSLIYKWIISWGGAKILKGWLAGFFLESLVSDLTTEQLRAYALFIWILTTIWFVLGIFIPTLRFYN